MSALGWATLGANALGGLLGGSSSAQDKTTSRAGAAMAATRQLEGQPLRQRIMALLGQNVGNNMPERFEAWGGKPAGMNREMLYKLPTNFQPDLSASNAYQMILDKLGYGGAWKQASLGLRPGERMTPEQYAQLPNGNSPWGGRIGG
jgi:hypothetical protein